MKKLILSLLLLASCAQPTHTKHTAHHGKTGPAPVQQVHCYTQHCTHDGTTDLLWWYLIMGSNNHYYYYSSPTPVSNFGEVTWQQSNTNPVAANNGAGTVDEMPVQDVNTNELSPQMQQEMNENPENFGGMTEDEMGDYEGTTDNSNEGTNSNEGSNSESSGSETGGSESSGGSDGGGSDGGGGGDGGGGE